MGHHERKSGDVGLLANIDVDDLDKAVAFYCAALGLRVGRRFGSFGAELLGAAAPIYVLQKSTDTVPFDGAVQRRDYRRHWTPVHLDFVVPDIQIALAQALKAGAHLEGAMRTHKWGHIAVLSDPFGHGFCLIEFLGRGYDEIAT